MRIASANQDSTRYVPIPRCTVFSVNRASATHLRLISGCRECSWLVNSELDLGVYPYWHRLALEPNGWFEAPVFHGFDCFLV